MALLLQSHAGTIAMYPEPAQGGGQHHPQQQQVLFYAPGVFGQPRHLISPPFTPPLPLILAAPPLYAAQQQAAQHPYTPWQDAWD